MSNNEIKIAKEKTKDITILLDMDSVCTDWFKSACEVCGVDLNDKSIRDKLKKGNDLNVIVPEEEIWNKINAEGADFWLNLELLPWAKKLHKALKDTGHRLFFCTSPGKNNSIPASPKIEYLLKHFNTNDFIIVYDKSACAGPNKILIDDSERKIKEFKKYGGNVFKWPNQFVLMDDNSSDEAIENAVKAVKDME